MPLAQPEPLKAYQHYLNQITTLKLLGYLCRQHLLLQSILGSTFLALFMPTLMESEETVAIFLLHPNSYLHYPSYVPVFLES